MKELIPINSANIAGQQVKTVNGRDLHKLLGVKKDFSNWIKKQIQRCKFVENRDFILLTLKGEQKTTGRGGHNVIEYYFTLDAGKHIGMMSGTDKGFEIRNYFLECEEIAQQSRIDPMKALNDPGATQCHRALTG